MASIKKNLGDKGFKEKSTQNRMIKNSIFKQGIEITENAKKKQ